MRIRRSRLLFLILLPGLLLAGYGTDPFGFEGQIARLANQPNVTTAFQHPESGRSDALIALVSFSVLTPLALCLLLITLVMVVKALEALLGSLRLPMWPSAPMVAMASIVATYATSESWLPMSRYALCILARAYVVYSYGQAPLH